MNSGGFMEKGKKSQETKQEIEIHQCSSMILNLKKYFDIILSRSDATNMPISAISLRSEKDVICELTGKPCVLYARGDTSSGSSPYINYPNLDRCPSSEEVVIKYGLKGTKKGFFFYDTEISRLEDKK